MKEATLTSAHVAESFHSVIDWNAVKSNVAILGHKVINLVASETFALTIASISAIGAWLYLATDHPVRFALCTIVACAALARAIVPMVKGGEK